MNAAESRPRAGLAAVVQTRMAEQEEGKGPREKWLMRTTVPKGRATVGLGDLAPAAAPGKLPTVLRREVLAWGGLMLEELIS